MMISNHAARLRIVAVWTLLCSFSLLPTRVYGVVEFAGGTGEPNSPFQIASAEQLIAIDSDPALLDKCFILIDNIDLGPSALNQPPFKHAVIREFGGVIDGNGLTISDFVITDTNSVGLIGKLKQGAQIKNLSLTGAKVTGSGTSIGILAGVNYGSIRDCFSGGTVSGNAEVGGLVGSNFGSVMYCQSNIDARGGINVGGIVGYNDYYSSVHQCSSAGMISGEHSLGGLVGRNYDSVINGSSTCSASGTKIIGGLIGYNHGVVLNAFCSGAVSGENRIGGLAGWNDMFGTISRCYSTGTVAGDKETGGLVGYGSGNLVTDSFWNKETSGKTQSIGGTGLTTAEMQDAKTYTRGGPIWDFVGTVEDGLQEIWQMPREGGYPVLGVFNGYVPPALSGCGTPESPYLISTAADLGAVIYYDKGACYRLSADIDLSGITWYTAIFPEFHGTFDANGLTIRNLKVRGGHKLGQAFIGLLQKGGQVKNLGMINADIMGTGTRIGTIVAYNRGRVSGSFSTGVVTGKGDSIGGLVGLNGSDGSVINCYSTAKVGNTGGSIGGLVGENSSVIQKCYCVGTVSGTGTLGGLLGWNDGGQVNNSLWDKETSGQTTSGGGTGLTSSQMKIIGTYLGAGWDFVGETANGSDEIWVMPDQSYPRLSWEDLNSK